MKNIYVVCKVLIQNNKINYHLQQVFSLKYNRKYRLKHCLKFAFLLVFIFLYNVSVLCITTQREETEKQQQSEKPCVLQTPVKMAQWTGLEEVIF